MKKLFLVLLLGGYGFGTIAQTHKPQSIPKQTPTLRGLGPFKINETTIAQMSRLCVDAGISLQESYSMHRTREAGDSAVAFRVPYESSDEYPDASPLASPDPHVAVYFFDSFLINDIKISELTLKFYDGVLASIETGNPGDLPDLFTVKYGKPTVSSLYRSSVCLYKLTGHKAVNKDGTYFSRWYNGDIVALSYASVSRDANCKEEYSSSFSITSTSKTKLIESGEKLALKKEAVKQQDVLRKRASGL